MATNTLNDYSNAPIADQDHFSETRTALIGDVVPRNSSGVPEDEAGNLGTDIYNWKEVHTKQLIINGTPFDPSAVASANTYNAIRSGRTRTDGAQPLFLRAAGGSTFSVYLLASSTNLLLTIGGQAATFSTDITLTGLNAAPSTNNTCIINDAKLSSQEFTKYIKYISITSAGSEITALINKVAAFQTAAGEIFLAFVVSSTLLIILKRGGFFNSGDAPIYRNTIANGQTITLLKAAWIFADANGSTLVATYNPPIYSGIAPSSPATNDYWFDSVTNSWKYYSSGAWVIANRIPIGIAISSTTGCIATRSFDFNKSFSDLNLITLGYNSASQLRSNIFENKVSVYGNEIFLNNLVTWDITQHLETGYTETANTNYYCYITEQGVPKISPEAPTFFAERLGAYHPYHTWRFICRFFNDSSSNIVGGSVVHWRIGDTYSYSYSGSTEFILNVNNLNACQLYMIGGGGSGMNNTANGGNKGGDTVFYTPTGSIIAGGGNGGLTGGGAGTGGTSTNGDVGFTGKTYSGTAGVDILNYDYFLLYFPNVTSIGLGGGGASNNSGGGTEAFTKRKYYFIYLLEECYPLFVANGGSSVGTGSRNGSNGALLIELM